MARDAILSECAQHLRQSSYEYEKLLGSSVGVVWQALGNHIERQLLSKKGVNIPMFGKFTFLRDVQPLTPIFILADRFAGSHSVAWKRPPPAPLTPTMDVSMSIIGSEVGLPKEQTLRTIEALVRFLGTKLQSGTASGRLRVGNAGLVCLEGKALVFAFNPGFVKSIAQSEKKAATGSTLAIASLSAGGVSDGWSNQKALMQRSMSLDTAIPTMNTNMKGTSMAGLGSNADAGNGADDTIDRAASHARNGSSHKDKARDKKRHHHAKSATTLDTIQRALEQSAVEKDADSNSSSDTPPNRHILPRFLLANKRVPDGARVQLPIPGSQYARAMQSAFDREREQRQHTSQLIAKEDAEIAVRHQATQMRELQQSAVLAIGRREMNAFLKRQLEEKQSMQRSARVAAAKETSYDAVKILPQEPQITDAATREAKHNLCKRLDDQVAAKEALKRDKRVLDQVESAYFISKLKLQAETEHREQLELKRIEKEAMFAGWKQQQALRHEATTASKRSR